MIRTIAAVAAAQLAVVGLAVAPQLTARLTGEDYLMQVRPVDPIDPFRGAYVALDYPGLEPALADHADDRRGSVFVTLVEREGYWEADRVTPERPDAGPYLACADTGWTTRCGIGTYFASQERALELEQSLADGGGVATVRIDGRGHASVVDVR